jgi:DNA replication factor GINS
MPADEEGLTTEEAELFSDLVAQIEAHRAGVLSSFDSDRAERGSEEGASGSGAEGSDRMGGTGPGSSSGETDRTLDVGEAMGGDGGASASPEGSDSSASRRSSVEASPGDADDDTEDADAADLAGDVTGSSEDDESTDGGRAAGEPERVTLRITRDVGEVFGVDERVYDLAAEDVVTLPEANAKPLLDRDAAEEID